MLFETLVTAEEMARAEETADYFCVHADNRDLNYDNYVIRGSRSLERAEAYTSHNTTRLGVDEMKLLLQKLSLFGGEY